MHDRLLEPDHGIVVGRRRLDEEAAERHDRRNGRRAGRSRFVQLERRVESGVRGFSLVAPRRRQPDALAHHRLQTGIGERDSELAGLPGKREHGVEAAAQEPGVGEVEERQALAGSIPELVHDRDALLAERIREVVVVRPAALERLARVQGIGARRSSLGRSPESVVEPTAALAQVRAEQPQARHAGRHLERARRPALEQP